MPMELPPITVSKLLIISSCVRTLQAEASNSLMTTAMRTSCAVKKMRRTTAHEERTFIVANVNERVWDGLDQDADGAVAPLQENFSRSLIDPRAGFGKSAPL